MVAIRPISLDSGLHSRLYDFVMATNHQTESTAMQIGEVAKRTSLTVDAIRFYEKRKLLPKAVRSAGRFRLYAEGTIARLHFIQQMQGLGFSLREVGELIQLRERRVDACESVKELLRTKLINVRARCHPCEPCAQLSANRRFVGSVTMAHLQRRRNSVSADREVQAALPAASGSSETPKVLWIGAGFRVHLAERGFGWNLER
jgi:MerR family copper efflux transcriptional regulator